MHPQTLYRILYILIAVGCISYREAGAGHKDSVKLHTSTFRLAFSSHSHVWPETRITHTRVSVPICAIIKSGGPRSWNSHGGTGGRVITWPTGHDPATSVCGDRAHTCTHTHSHIHNLSYKLILQDSKFVEWLHARLEMSEPSVCTLPMQIHWLGRKLQATWLRVKQFLKHIPIINWGMKSASIFFFKWGVLVLI